MTKEQKAFVKNITLGYGSHNREVQDAGCACVVETIYGCFRVQSSNDITDESSYSCNDFYIQQVERLLMHINDGFDTDEDRQVLKKIIPIMLDLHYYANKCTDKLPDCGHIHFEKAAKAILKELAQNELTKLNEEILTGLFYDDFSYDFQVNEGCGYLRFSGIVKSYNTKVCNILFKHVLKLSKVMLNDYKSYANA